MRKMLILIILFISFSYVQAQTAPDTLWTKTYGGVSDDSARSVEQTADGGYIIAGYTYSYGAGESDFWLIKTDLNGNEQWNQTYGGVDYDYAYSVQQTTDGGYIIAGFTESSVPGGSDYWLVKTDESGNEEWNQTYGGVDDDYVRSIQQTTDGGFIIAGFTHSYGAVEFDFLLVKIDENGIEEWNQTYGGIGNDFANSVQQTIDGGYIIAGTTSSYGAGNHDCWLIKTDENGNEEWDLTYGGIDDDYANSIQQTVDEGYIIVGFTDSFGAGSWDYWLIKTDEDGNEEWDLTYGGIDDDRAYSVQQTIDEGYIIAGSTNSYGAWGHDFWLIKTDENGNEEWNQTYDSSSFDKARSIQQTSDGGYIVAGYCSSDNFDIWLIRLESEFSIANNMITESLFINVSNYPNPFNPSTTIEFSIQNDSQVELSIHNIKGQKIKTLTQNEYTKGTHSIIWNGETESGESVSSGVYLYKLKVNEQTTSMKKCLLLK